MGIILKKVALERGRQVGLFRFKCLPPFYRGERVSDISPPGNFSKEERIAQMADRSSANSYLMIKSLSLKENITANYFINECDHHGHIFAPRSWIRAAIGFTTRTIGKHLAKLKSIGLIVRWFRTKGGITFVLNPNFCPQVSSGVENLCESIICEEETAQPSTIETIENNRVNPYWEPNYQTESNLIRDGWSLKKIDRYAETFRRHHRVLTPKGHADWAHNIEFRKFMKRIMRKWHRPAFSPYVHVEPLSCNKVIGNTALQKLRDGLVDKLTL